MIVYVANQVMHVSALHQTGTVSATWSLSTASALQCATGYALSLPVATRAPPPRRRFGAPRDLSWHARLSQGLVPPPRVSRGPAARWRPLPVRLVPRVTRRQSRLA